MSRTVATARLGTIRELALVPVVDPDRAFRALSAKPALAVVVGLFLFRWIVTAVNTVGAMYLHDAPMLLPPPFGLDAATWRRYEIFWYAPYGMAFMLVIVATLAAAARRAGAAAASFRAMFAVVAVAYFAPWLPTAIADAVLIPLGLGTPAVIVPIHVAALFWETLLLARGLRVVFGLGVDAAGRLSLLAMVMFLCFGALLMR